MTYLELADLNYKHAKRDLTTFNEEQEFGILAYHVQQAFELYLKYEISKFGVEPKRTHQIGLLIEELSSHRSLKTRERALEQIALTLSEWEAYTRYPPGLLTARNDLVHALNVYESIRGMNAGDEDTNRALDTLAGLGYSIPMSFIVEHGDGAPMCNLPKIISEWEAALWGGGQKQ